MNRSSVSLNRASRRLAVLVLAVSAALVGSVSTAAVASAHVSVSSTDAAAGGFGKLTFRVPNESDTASTVKVRIQIPEEAALAFLSVQPVPGWTVTLTRSDLAQPVESEGESVTSYVSVVEFRAADGGGIGPGEFQEFALSGGPIPDADSVSFPTVQTYSDGTETAWIEPTVGGQEPEHPAPTLTLTASGDAASVTDPADTASESEDSSGTAVVALVVAIVALVVALAGGVLGWRASRRTVSS
jgi:uncharacterized protein YcnI